MPVWTNTWHWTIIIFLGPKCLAFRSCPLPSCAFGKINGVHQVVKSHLWPLCRPLEGDTKTARVACSPTFRQAEPPTDSAARLMRRFASERIIPPADLKISKGSRPFELPGWKEAFLAASGFRFPQGPIFFQLRLKPRDSSEAPFLKSRTPSRRGRGGRRVEWLLPDLE